MTSSNFCHKTRLQTQCVIRMGVAQCAHGLKFCIRPITFRRKSKLTPHYTHLVLTASIPGLWQAGLTFVNFQISRYLKNYFGYQNTHTYFRYPKQLFWISTITISVVKKQTFISDIKNCYFGYPKQLFLISGILFYISKINVSIFWISKIHFQISQILFYISRIIILDSLKNE